MAADRTPALRRGFILLALHGQYPLPLARPMFERAVAAFYTGDDAGLARDIAYLIEKKLMTVDTERLMNRAVETCKLTAEGCDVVEGATQIPGVEIVRA